VRRPDFRALVFIVPITVTLLFGIKPAVASGRVKAIHVFQAKPGASPYGNLVSDTAGNFYGGTLFGGGSGCGGTGCGTVYEMSPVAGGWTFSNLYTFRGGLDGVSPAGGLVLDTMGNLYGATFGGGAKNMGTIFELSPAPAGGWTKSTIYDFGMINEDGSIPFAGMVFDQSGNLYGTTSIGGQYGYGTVFELSPGSGGWTETVIYSFQFNNVFPTDGGTPYAPVLFDTSGNLYGTTFIGGADAGTVFKLTPSGSGTWNEEVIYSFLGGTDGANPQAGMNFDPAGNLYGTTSAGGGLEEAGTVFKLTSNFAGWQESVLHTFRPSKGDGGLPAAAPILDAEGNLYGTTAGGNAPLGPGTVYKLSLNANGNWIETRYNFAGGAGGESPWGGLIFDASGNLLGTTEYGGAGPGSGYGLVFEIKQ